MMTESTLVLSGKQRTQDFFIGNPLAVPMGKNGGKSYEDRVGLKCRACSVFIPLIFENHNFIYVAAHQPVTKNMIGLLLEQIILAWDTFPTVPDPDYPQGQKMVSPNPVNPNDPVNHFRQMFHVIVEKPVSYFKDWNFLHY